MDSQVPCYVSNCSISIFTLVQQTDKHPSTQPASADSLLEPGSIRAPLFDPVLLDSLTGDLIKLFKHRALLVLLGLMPTECVHLLEMPQ